MIDFIKELNNQNVKPFSIYYRVKLYTFLDGKYKYYRVYVNSNTITLNDIEPYNMQMDIMETKAEKKKNNLELKNNLSKKSKESKKVIKLLNNGKKTINGISNITNNFDNSAQTKNAKNNIERNNQSEMIKEESNKADNIDKNNNNRKVSISSFSSQTNISMSGFNKIKNIKNNEIFMLFIWNFNNNFYDF